jgi:glycerol-3-phosphate O-acyltransferase 3/4
LKKLKLRGLQRKKLNCKSVTFISSKTTPLEFRFDLGDVAPILIEGTAKVVEDGFTCCFTSSNPHPWNWNIYLYPAWIFGVVIRYCILFPLRFFGSRKIKDFDSHRALCLLLATTFVATVMFLSEYIWKDPKIRGNRQRKIIQLYCQAFVASWSGVIKFILF